MSKVDIKYYDPESLEGPYQRKLVLKKMAKLNIPRFKEWF